MIKRKIKQKNSAVSEVLDTILLLGIAVALFSVVSIVVLSYPFNPSAPTVNIIGWVEEGTDGFSNILLEHRGGESLDLDTPVIITIAGSQVLIDDQIPTAGDLLDYIAIQDTISPNYWNIGEKLNYSVGNLAGKQVTVTVIDKKSNSVILMGTLQEGISSPPTLTINVVGGGSVAKVPNQATYAFDTIVTLTPTADPGWTFDSWGGSDAGDLVDNGDGTWSITMDSDKSVTATFTQDQYYLSITTDFSGSVVKDPDQATYTYGNVVVLTPVPNSGWGFDGWSGPDSGDLVDNGDGTWSITMDSDKSVTATFTQDQYALSINTVGSGSVTGTGINCPGDCSEIYLSGTTVTLTAVAQDDWIFDHWEGGLNGDNNPDVITMDGDKTVTAVFIELFTLSVDVSPTGQGTVTLNPSGGIYADGTSVELTANAVSGWAFDYWSGDVPAGSENDNPLTITMNSDKTVTAQFKLEYTLILRPNAKGDTTDLSRNGGSNNWGRVDEVDSDGDSTYVYSNNDGNFRTDTYNLQNPSLSGTITKVTVYVNVRRASDSGAPTSGVSARTAIRLGGGSVEYGATTPDLSTSWMTYSTEYTTKQGNLGSGSWTWTDIDNLQIGVSLRSQNDYYWWSNHWSYARCTQVWVEVTYTL